MKSFKRNFALLMSLFMLVAALAGCAPAANAPNEATPTPAPTAGQEPVGEAAFTAGTYSATEQANNGPLTVNVTFSDSAIVEVAVGEHSETPGISDPAFARIPAAIVDGQTLAVDTVAGATFTSKAILAAVEACVVQAGGDVNALKQGGGAEVEKTESTRDVEVLVAGGGLAGLMAAITAADGGAKVLLIEKMPALGGTTITSGGYFITSGSGVPNPDGVDDSMETLMQYWHKIMEAGPSDTGYPDYARVENVLTDTGKTVDYMISFGIPFKPALVNPFGGTPVAVVDGGGAALISSLAAAAEAKGVEILLDCKAESLITDASGAVTGVVSSTPTENLTINAKSVVLATGGFGSNPEMVAEYSPEITQVVPLSAAGSMGDGIKMAEAIGAAKFESYWSAFNSVAVGAAYSRAVAEAKTLPLASSLLVNGQGNRFANEFSSHRAELTYKFVKDVTEDHYALFDGSNADIQPILEAGLATGEVFKGDTVDALAAAMGVDATALAASVERYNALAAAGSDEDFGKAAELLVPVATAPFYAVKYYPTTFGSTGGVKTDVATGNVLRADGTGIANLYAAGEMSNRDFYNQHYILAASLAFYSTMGLRAGAAAAVNAK